jgi:Tfp pilus assembly protein PilO
MQQVIRQKLRTVNAAGAAGIILLVAATVAFGIVPLYQHGRRDIQETARLRDSIKALEDLERTITQVEHQRQVTEGRLQQVENRLSGTSDSNALIADLAKVTRSAGIRVDGTTYPRELKECGAYKALPVEIAGTANWESCYRFLVGLRSGDRLTRLDSLILETDRVTSPQPADQQICHMTANFSTFFMDR